MVDKLLRDEYPNFLAIYSLQHGITAKILMSAETSHGQKIEHQAVSHTGLTEEPDPNSEDLGLVLDNEKCWMILSKLLNLSEPVKQEKQY